MATNPTATSLTQTLTGRMTLGVTAQFYTLKIIPPKSVFNNPRLLLFYQEASVQPPREEMPLFSCRPQGS